MAVVTYASGGDPTSSKETMRDEMRDICVRMNGHEDHSPGKVALIRTSEMLRGDREVIMAAIQREGSALKYATYALRCDREIVLAAVAQDGDALSHASEALRADREVALVAVGQCGRALEHVSEALRADREVALVAARQSGKALKHVSEALRADREVVLLAVSHTSDDYYFQSSLKLASDALRADRGVVAAASTHDLRELGYSLGDLTGNSEFMLAVVASVAQLDAEDGSLLRTPYYDETSVPWSAGRSCVARASTALQDDETFILSAVRLCPDAIYSASSRLRENRKFVMGLLALST